MKLADRVSTLKKLGAPSTKWTASPVPLKWRYGVIHFKNFARCRKWGFDFKKRAHTLSYEGFGSQCRHRRTGAQTGSPHCIVHAVGPRRNPSKI